MTDLSAAIDIAVDTDPLLLRDALDAVLATCDRFEKGVLHGSSSTSRFVAQEFRRSVAKALKVSYP